MPQEALLGWVWRIPFLASIVLIAVAVFIRLRLKESPTFVKLEKQEQVAEHPLREVFRTSSPSLLRGIGLRMAENGGSYIYQTLAITYVTKLGVQSSIGPLAVAVGAMLGFFTIPLAGALSDRYGRMRVYRVGAIVQLVLALRRLAAAVAGQRRPSPWSSSRSPTASASTSCSAPSAPPCPSCSAPATATSASPSPVSSAPSSPAASPPSSAHCCWPRSATPGSRSPSTSWS